MSRPPRPPREDPLVFSAKQIHRQPGASQTDQRLVPVQGVWGNAVSRVVDGETVETEFLLESAHDGILVAGRAQIPVRADCVRCLIPISWDQEINVQQFFAYPESAPDADEDDDGDVAKMTGDFLDLRGAFRDAVVLALPLTPVCREDCLGLCSECGFALAQDPSHKHERIDPRWGALAGRGQDPSDEAISTANGEPSSKEGE